MNSDGTPDVATANRLRSVSVFSNAGDGTLAEITESPFPAGDQAGHIALGDLNNDGNLDAVTANNVSNDLSILLGDGTGALAAAPASPIVLDARVNSPALRDINGDSLPDLMFLRASQDQFVLALGEGEGRLGERVATLVGDRPTSIATDDLNGDGHTDVVIGLGDFNDRPPDSENGDITVLLGDGAGAFTRLPQRGFQRTLERLMLPLPNSMGVRHPTCLFAMQQVSAFFRAMAMGHSVTSDLLDFPLTLFRLMFFRLMSIKTA